MAIYLAFVLDWDTTPCFLFSQVIKFTPRKLQYPVVHLLSEGDHASPKHVKASTHK